MAEVCLTRVINIMDILGFFIIAHSQLLICEIPIVVCSVGGRIYHTLLMKSVHHLARGVHDRCYNVLMNNICPYIKLGNVRTALTFYSRGLHHVLRDLAAFVRRYTPFQLAANATPRVTRRWDVPPRFLGRENFSATDVAPGFAR